MKITNHINKRKMKVGELIEALSHYDDDDDVTFYFMITTTSL